MSVVDEQIMKDIGNAIEFLTRLKSEKKLFANEGEKEEGPEEEKLNIPINVDAIEIQITEQKLKEPPTNFILQKKKPTGFVRLQMIQQMALSVFLNT